MGRITYKDGGKWRMRIGDAEHSGKDVDRIAALENILDDDYDIARLRELFEADQDGRCVVLPVKRGTPVWSTAFCRLDEDGKEHPTYPWPFGLEMVDEWGKEWFLTREEAEAALKERNKNG